MTETAGEAPGEIVFARPPGGLVRDPRALLAWMGVEEPLSIRDLVLAGSLDISLAAALWVLLARRRSLIVAARPRLAGKSTTLAALLEMVPPGVSFYPIGGTFSVGELRGLGPQDVYLVVNEVSDHLPGRYLWGEGVRELLRARAAGYPFAATLHTGSPEEALALFTDPPLSIAASQVAGIDAVLVLRDGRLGPKGVEAAALVESLDSEGRIAFRTLARWDPRQGAFRHVVTTERARALAVRLGLDAMAMGAELTARETYLKDLLSAPVPGDRDWRAALARFST